MTASPIVVVVTGGRYYDREDIVFCALDKINEHRQIGMVIHGACPYDGADLLGEKWARSREIAYAGLPARFTSEGKSGGPRRNRLMIEWALSLGLTVVVVHFPGDRGTADCITAAKERTYDGSNAPIEIHDGAALAWCWGVS